MRRPGATGGDLEAERASRSASRGLLAETLAPHRRALLIAAALVVVATAGALAVPFLVKFGIDRGVVPGDPSLLAVAAGLVVAAAGTGAVVQRAAERQAGRVAEEAVFDLRLRLGRHLQSLSFEVFDRQRSGTLLSAGTNDVEAVYELFSSASLTVVPTVLYMVGVAVVLVVLDWILALVVLVAVLPVLYATTITFRNRSTRAYRRVREANARVVGYVSETLAGIRVVQAFGREATRQADFEDLNHEHRSAKVRAARFSSGYGPFTLALGNVALFLVLIVGGFRAVGGAITVGTIAAFLLYLRQFFNPLQDLTQFHDSLRAAGAGLERLATLLATSSTVPDRPEARSLPEGRGALCLQGVSFAYGETKALTDIALEVRAGETLAMVGTTGAGKSTIAKLIARFYDPAAGRVLLEGQDLRDTASASIRSQVALLSQEPHLFRGTIADNIALGRPDATTEEIVEAAEAVGAARLIVGLPDGYSTEVVEAGSRLSAGQRQLIALSRAWLVSPRVLILDEATSALDLPTERRALASLQRLVSGRTAVVISHRQAAVDIADRVAVVEAGRVVEIGTPAELLAADTRFRRFHQQWRAAHSVA